MNGRAWWPAWGYLALAVGVAVAAPLLWWATEPEAETRVATAPAPPATPAPAPLPGASTAAPAEQAGQPAPTPPSLAASLPAASPGPSREPDGDRSVTLANYVNPGESPSMKEVIARLHQAGERTGLGAFQPPGTRPPLVGLAVPEGFELPPGYVRHHQSTDDGQRIEAILMFAPGLQLFDASGQPIAMPADRVVPPELAPPGLPLRRIVVPTMAPEPGR